MKKVLLAALAAALVLAACGQGSEESGSTEEPDTPADDQAAEPTEDEEGEPDASADDDETDDQGSLSGQLAVAVYGGPTETAWQEAFGAPYAEVAPDVDAVIAGVPNPSSLAFTQEGDQQFDVLLVTGTNVAQILDSDTQLYEPIDPSSLSRSGEVYEDLVLTDDDGAWVAVPVFITYYGIVYNTDHVDEGAITSWADLADPMFENRLLVNSPFFFSTVDLPMFALANGGGLTDLEPGLELLEESLPNVRATVGNLAEAASQMASGEVYASPFYFSQYSQLLDGGAAVDMVLPEEGGLLSPLYLMIVADSPNVENALGFIDVVLQVENQEVAGEKSSYVPVVQDADLIDKISERSGFASTEELLEQLVMPDFFHLAEQQGENTQRIEDMLAQ